MQTTFSLADLRRSVIAVPPLCRDANLKPNAAENRKLMQHIEAGGVNILLYGGNANFYNIALSEFEEVLDQLEACAGATTLVIPSVGPYRGFALDQAAILARKKFPTAMLLPTVAVSKPEGVRATVMELAQKMQKPVVLYIKDEGYVTVDVVKSLVDAGVISWIKYAVVRQDPLHDPLLDKLTHAVSRDLIVSGIGEQPAIVHWQHFGVEAYTAGCVCIAPNRSQEMLMELQSGDLETAEEIRRRFTKLEDLRNTYGPIPVLHHAVKLAGIADTGPMLPLMADLDEKIQAKISDAARDVLAWSID